MKNAKITHEIVSVNPDVDVRLNMSIDQGSYVSPHWHNSIELVYMIEGSMDVYFENHKVHLAAGEFILINPRVIHSVLSKKNHALLLQIPEPVLKRFISDSDLTYFEVDMHPESLKYQQHLHRLKEDFREMYEVYAYQPKGYLLRFYSLFYDFLYVLISYYSKTMLKEDATKNEKILNQLKEIMIYIETHHKEPLTVRGLAQIFGYNPDYFSRFFKKHLGLSVIDYIYEIRLNHIEQDLHDPNLRINEIFENHGCTNYRVTMKKFKQRFSCTPKQKQKEFLSQSK